MTDDIYKDYPAGGLSIKKYCEHRKKLGLPGANYRTVKKALDDGRISYNEHRKISPREADEQWAMNTDPGRDPLLHVRTQSGNTASNMSPAFVPHYNESRARNEFAKAQKQELELRQLRGELVNKNEVYAEFFALARSVRDQILSIPVRVAPTIASLDDPTEIEHKLEDEMTKVLADLVPDDQ